MKFIVRNDTDGNNEFDVHGATRALAAETALGQLGWSLTGPVADEDDDDRGIGGDGEDDDVLFDDSDTDDYDGDEDGFSDPGDPEDATHGLLDLAGADRFLSQPPPGYFDDPEPEDALEADPRLPPAPAISAFANLEGIRADKFTPDIEAQPADPEAALRQFVGASGVATPDDDDTFDHEFQGTCVGVRNGLLQIRDVEDNVCEVRPDQFAPDDCFYIANPQGVATAEVVE